jgi:hypothetical protein
MDPESASGISLSKIRKYPDRAVQISRISFVNLVALCRLCVSVPREHYFIGSCSNTVTKVTRREGLEREGLERDGW